MLPSEFMYIYQTKYILNFLNMFQKAFEQKKEQLQIAHLLNMSWIQNIELIPKNLLSRTSL